MHRGCRGLRPVVAAPDSAHPPGQPQGDGQQHDDSDREYHQQGKHGSKLWQPARRTATLPGPHRASWR